MASTSKKLKEQFGSEVGILRNIEDLMSKILRKIRGIIHWAKTKTTPGRDGITNKMVRVYNLSRPKPLENSEKSSQGEKKIPPLLRPNGIVFSD